MGESPEHTIERLRDVIWKLENLNLLDETANRVFRDKIEREYTDNPTGAGNSFDEILCYEIHHGSDGEHEGGLTFLWLADKWGISVSFLGELIHDHCIGLEGS
jgi:hypothetical protein